MKAIIFAGGSGTRLWPLSRKKSPKQFEKIIGDKSTLELAVERLLPDFKYEDIYISSNIIYKDLIRKKLPKIPEKNLILEPVKKDVAPAIALAAGILHLKNPNEPIAILWSDHLVKKVGLFKKMIKAAANYVSRNPEKIIFISHKPRFPSVNLGYIHFGKPVFKNQGVMFYEFKDLKYRPDRKTAQTFFSSADHAWNLGYFVTTAQFIHDVYKRLSPEIFRNTETILKHYGKNDYNSVLGLQYRKVKSMSFDNAILEKLNKKDAMVMVEDIGWSDVGSWEALKEAIQTHQLENITRGRVYLEESNDCLVYNYEDKKLIVGVDLKENIVINTHDVLLITTKHSMHKVKKIIESFVGTEHEHLT